jgi:hypothetical protein
VFGRFEAMLVLLLTLWSSSADSLTEWNDALLDSIRAENTHPCIAARALAIVHGAMHDTAAAIG